MICDSIKRMTETEKLLTVEDMTEAEMSGRSAAHTACWKYLQLKSYDSALEHAKAIINRDPAKPDGYVFKARALMKLGKYREAEETLLHLIRMSDDNELIKKDVEGMIKLKDELANARVEILRSFNFRNAIDMAEIHWNDCKESIIELIGFANLSENRMKNSNQTSNTPMDVDIEIIDIIGSEKAKQLEMLTQSDKNNSTGNDSFSGRRTMSSGNLNLSGDFPAKESPKKSSANEQTKTSNNDFDNDLRTAGLRTALMLSEDKNRKYERKVNSLEEELKRVYNHLIKVNEEKKSMELKINRLVDENKAIEIRSNRMESELNLKRRKSEQKQRLIRLEQQQQKLLQQQKLQQQQRQQQKLQQQREIERQHEIQVQRQIQRERELRERAAQQSYFPKTRVFTNSNRVGQRFGQTYNTGSEFLARFDDGIDRNRNIQFQYRHNM